MRFAAWPAAYLLALVPGVVALFAYAFRRRRLALAEFVTGELAPRVLPPTGARRAWPRALCLAAAAACLVVALMQPQWGPGGQELFLLSPDSGAEPGMRVN